MKDNRIYVFLYAARLNLQIESQVKILSVHIHFIKSKHPILSLPRVLSYFFFKMVTKAASNADFRAKPRSTSRRSFKMKKLSYQVHADELTKKKFK